MATAIVMVVVDIAMVHPPKSVACRTSGDEAAPYSSIPGPKLSYSHADADGRRGI